MKIAIVTLPIDGHLNPLGDLGTRLSNRGFEVIMISLPSANEKVKRLNYPFLAIGRGRPVANEFDNLLNLHKKISGVASLRLGIKQVIQSIEMLEEELPPIIKKEKIKLLLIDQMLISVPISAIRMNIPYITVCAALEINQAPGVPPYFSHYSYGEKLYQKILYTFYYQLLNFLTNDLYKKVKSLIKKHHLKMNTKSIIDLQSLHSKRATIITQCPPSLAFKSISGIHYTGPFLLEKNRPVIDFPWEKLKVNKPIIYASLGTMFTGFTHIYQKIADALKDLDIQLIISTGRNDIKITTYNSQIVVTFAPQLEIFKKASLFITHGGMNSVLEALKNKVPLLVIPIAHDQPGVAARVKACGAGEFIKMRKLTIKNLKENVHKILTHSNYREAATKVSTDIIASGGGEKACDIIEKIITKIKK